MADTAASVGRTRKSAERGDGPRSCALGTAKWGHHVRGCPYQCGDGGAPSLQPMAPQFIITMRNLRRVVPPDREILRGINISMYPGAKIGVLGSNGAGKSTLLRIMGGEDDGYQGEVRLTPGFTVGHLAQEPRLDPNLDVSANVALGAGEIKAVLDRYNEV